MKRLFIFMMTVVMTISISAAELNAQQSKLRDDILTFLREEGFMPEIDSDGDIFFKREGKKWYIEISSTDYSPMYISLKYYYGYDKNCTKEKLIAMQETLNAYKGLKLVLSKKVFYFSAEMYVVNAEPLKYAFYKLIDQINNMNNEMIELVSQISPVTFESAYIANVEKNGDIIVDFGKYIYNYHTKYLQVKMYANVSEAGSYTFNVKFYNADGNLTNAGQPSKYSYSKTVNLSKGYQSVLFPGWGNDNKGNWKAGKYLVEIYLDDQKIGSKEFEIY